MSAILEHEASALCRDSGGRTALHLAASCGHTELLRSLLQAATCADPLDYLLDFSGYTPSHWAAYHGETPLPPTQMRRHFLVVLLFHSDLKKKKKKRKKKRLKKNLISNMSFLICVCFCPPQDMRTVWTFYLKTNHLVSRKETPLPHCTVLCKYHLYSSSSHDSPWTPPSVSRSVDAISFEFFFPL